MMILCSWVPCRRASNVIIGTHHADEKTLAETAWTDKEKAVRLVFQLRQIHCLVHIILISLDDIDEIRHSVRGMRFTAFCSISLSI